MVLHPVLRAYATPNPLKSESKQSRFAKNKMEGRLRGERAMPKALGAEQSTNTAEQAVPDGTRQVTFLFMRDKNIALKIKGLIWIKNYCCTKVNFIPPPASFGIIFF